MTKIMKDERGRTQANVAVYGIFEKDGQILFQQRANTSYMNGYYSVPAGHVDDDESLITALIRECKEEVGVDITPEDVSFSQVQHVVTDSIYLCFFFKISKYKGEIKNMEEDKCSDLRFFPKNNPPEKLIPELKAYLQGISNEAMFVDGGK